ncbi:putative dual specificity protein phosphatase [Echria macrotheca]|uniref:Dual specificity protein phosphatase n=1 Tax=Echria macrotheca TaxID=438768 RepID=A0AAJ0BQF2_9PEZI|nr:putative dual specificity protein phosphatase [Echria macrotheca]
MMATITLPRPIASHRPGSDYRSPSAMVLEGINSPTASQPCPGPVPNKHIPVCPPGPVPQEEPSTPPPSPGSDEDQLQQSLLFPPDKYIRLDSGKLAVYKIDAADVAAALDHVSRQPLPDPSQVFPWFHGLHPSNQIQQAFFIARKRALRRTPGCLRGITLVKADGDLNVSRLKGAIAPHEFLQLGNAAAEFLDIDPREGFSVRNFQIQAAKAAMTSDIIVYGDDEVLVRKLGWDIAAAQQRWRTKHEIQRHDLPDYNTFICISPFSEFEKNHPEVIAVDSAGRPTGNVLDFANQERLEMYAMTEASEISHNVWLGPTPDQATEEEQGYDILIECSDLGRLDHGTLVAIAEGGEETAGRQYIDFPSSGSILAPTWSHAEADIILETCKWIWHLAHGTHPSASESSAPDEDGDVPMFEETDGESKPSNFQSRPRKILIHCADGYTESTLLGIAYYSYSTGRPVPDAWLHLHTTMKRNFFAYPSDVALLTAISPRLLHESPASADRSLSEITALIREEPRWFTGFDGSFPSRILDYMYLGNLGHANNPDLLRSLGIGQILSVGEMAMWRDGELEEWGVENTCVVQGVQDNGIDPLTDEFERCLEFIDRGRRNGTATLVHCRVGVSRSATICIAEVMRALGLSFPRAYCFVRARRLNVIIQPHLRFAYELLKWEEALQTQRDQEECEGDESGGIRRELEWGEIAREVALMNRPYAR